MADVSYILPDTLRGDPSEREAFAVRSGCDLVEVALGDLPPPAIPWVLRVASTDEDGRDQPRWHDRAWTTRWAADAAGTADRPPTAIVIEPGKEWNGPGAIVRAIAAIRDGFHVRFGANPAVLIANRADQSIPDGAGFAEFWDHLLRQVPALAPHTGLALDASEFYAATRSRMAAELTLVPPDALRYVRLHTRGGKPDLGDPLPWRAVFGLIRQASNTVLIAPAVEDPVALEPAILFCMLSLQGRAFT